MGSDTDCLEANGQYLYPSGFKATSLSGTTPPKCATNAGGEKKTFFCPFIQILRSLDRTPNHLSKASLRYDGPVQHTIVNFRLWAKTYDWIIAVSVTLFASLAWIYIFWSYLSSVGIIPFGRYWLLVVPWENFNTYGSIRWLEKDIQSNLFIA